MECSFPAHHFLGAMLRPRDDIDGGRKLSSANQVAYCEDRNAEGCPAWRLVRLGFPTQVLRAAGFLEWEISHKPSRAEELAFQEEQYKLHAERAVKWKAMLQKQGDVKVEAFASLICRVSVHGCRQL